jgi:hypothetical protein
MIRLAIVVQAVALFLAAAPAMAAEGPNADLLIQQGLDQRRDGKPDEALKLFQRAHAIAPSPRTFGQMGLVEASLKRWVDADMHLSVSLTNPDDPWVLKNRAFLEQALVTSKQHIGDLVISGPAGTEVFIGGQSVGTLPSVPPVRLVEGPISVSATAAGFKPFDQTVVIRPGARTPIAVVLSPIAVETASTVVATGLGDAQSLPEAPTTEQQVSRRSKWHTWTGASLAVAGASVLAWGVVWIAIDNNDACGSIHGSSCGTVYNTKTPGWILAGVGSAAIAAGAVVFFTGRGTVSSNVAVGLGPNALVLRGRF